MFRKLARWILFFRWPLLLALALVTIIMAGAVFRLRIDPSMESLFIKDAPEYQYYKAYRDKYGSDQMIAVAMETTDLFKLPNLWRLSFLTEAISEFPQVERVLSLGNVMDIKHRLFGVRVVPAMKGVLEKDRSLADFKQDVMSNELYLNNLVSSDGKIANILISLKPDTARDESAGVFMEQLRRFLEANRRPGVAYYMAGSPVEQYDFINLIRRDQFIFVPMITILLMVTTFVIYRSFSCMVVSISTVFTTIIWLLGTISLMGLELNLMTSLLAPVIMIISVVNSIHLMNLFFEIRPHHPSLRESIQLTIEQLGVPCFLTHLTTILGFGSLALSPIPAIQSFGTFAALGTLYSYFVEILLTPILLPVLPYRRVGESFSDRQFFNRVVIGFLERLEFRWKYWIVGISVIVIGVSAWGMTRIQVDTSLLKQMKPDLPLAISTRLIDERLTGVYTIGFVIRRKDGQGLINYKNLKELDDFKTFLESKPEITKVNTITTVIKRINEARENDKEAYRIPEDEDMLHRYFDGLAESKDKDVWKLISPDFREVRLEARMRAVGTREGAQVEDAARTYLADNMSKDYDYQLTGNVVLLGRMARDLVNQQLRSFTFAFFSILLVIMFIFRSVKMGFLAAIPNLLPILAVYGMMGFIGIELSSTTAMISSIVLGMVVDASIHFLHRFRMEFNRRFHYLQSLHHTFRNVGQALMVSTLILVAGFGTSIFASFRPTIYFGVLTSITILLALICTLVVLPVVLVLVKPFGEQKLFQKGGRPTRLRQFFYTPKDNTAPQSEPIKPK